MNVGQMYFDDRRRNTFYGIMNRKGSMRISACIQDNSIAGKTGFMEFVNELAFRIRLKIIDFNGRIKRFQLL